jgi:hypothetical protein
MKQIYDIKKMRMSLEDEYLRSTFTFTRGLIWEESLITAYR